MHERPAFRPVVFGLLLALFSTASVVGLAAASGFAAGESEGVGIVFAPGTRGDESIRRVLAAGAMPVAAGALSNIALARVEGPHTVRALYRAGAWLVFGANVAGCGARASATSRLGNDHPPSRRTTA